MSDLNLTDLRNIAMDYAVRHNYYATAPHAAVGELVLDAEAIYKFLRESYGS